ncbi:MAG: hypothetical protein WKG32_05895 [Gemmatimonadaceae bacterium]
MPRFLRGTLLRLVLLALSVVAVGCIISRGVRISEVRAGPADSVTVRSAVKAHLADGSTIVFRRGVTVARDTVRGQGTRFDVALAGAGVATRIPLDSVLAMESFQTEVNGAKTVLYSTLATAGALLGTVGLACAADPKCFGSCPTFYADSAGTPVLEAEGFSSSISPLLEARDVDRLRAQPGPDGRLRLQVWNEALETHYINHLELLEIGHASDEMALPDERGRPVVVRALTEPTLLRDRLGRDLRRTLARTDGDVFRTDARALAAVSPEDNDDYIELTAVAPAGVDSAALVLRLRNSLLNTVVFYDYMLAKPGGRSLDWMAHDLNRIDRMAEVGRWYGQYFGLRVAVRDGAAWREVAKLSDYGPIAWRDVALPIPVPRGDSLRLRISFVADQWRIDRLSLAGSMRRATPRVVPLASVTDRDGAPVPAALADLRAADERYLRTTPRQRFTATFDVGAEGSSARTFLLASQGWYTEWVRGSWLKGAHDSTTFSPTSTTLLQALRSWSVQRDSMERQFFRSRIPVY